MFQENKYYRMPFNPGALFSDEGSIAICSTAESIAHNIMLLITTRKGENRFDEDYGNEVWDIEFDNAATQVLWEQTFINSLTLLILEHEQRITNPIVKVHTSLVHHTYKTKSFTVIKKKATIAVNAKLFDSGEHFSFSTEIFLSPMSID